MKNLIILVLVLNCYLDSQPSIELPNPENFYSVSSLYMNVIKLDEGELIFYGGDGGVLRTYDNGQSWHQSYSGTKSYIPKMRYYNNNIYGVTYDGKFMKSSDKGDFWDYQQLSNGFNDLVIHKNSIYLSTYSDSVFVSGDDGNSWKKYKLNIDSILNISSFEDYIIINTKTGKLFYTDDINSQLKELEKPLNSFYVNNKYEGFYIYSHSQIAELKSDLTWKIYDVSSFNRRFKFIPEENQFTIFSANRNTRSELGLETYALDRNTKELEFKNKFRNELINSTDPVYNREYESFDVEVSKGVYFSSNYYKTILTTVDLVSWEININCNIIGNIPMFVFDENNIAISKSGIAEFVRSSDGGKTFKIKQNIPYDTVDGKELIPRVDDIYMVDKDNALIKLNNTGYFHSGGSSPFSKSFIEIKDGEYKFLDVDFKYSLGNGFIDNIYLINNVFEEYIIELRHQSKKMLPDENGKQLDSIYYYKYYAYHDSKVDTFYNLTLPIIFHKNLNENGKKYFTGNLEFDDSTKKGKTILYSMKDVFENIKIEHEFDFGIAHNGIHKDENNNYVILRGADIYLYDSNFNLVRIIETDYESIEIVGNFSNIKDTYFLSGKQYSDTINGVVFNRYKSFMFYINENYEPVEVESEDRFILFQESKFNKNYKYYIENRGIYQALFIPIEPERLEYYASSIERGGPPSIWTYPPYPNPVKDRLKMKFYSAMMGEIAKLKVELIHIGTGRVYHIDKYGLNIIDDNWGEIEIDITGYIRGAYLINFKLGDGNKSEAIIIE